MFSREVSIEKKIIFFCVCSRASRVSFSALIRPFNDPKSTTMTKSMPEHWVKCSFLSASLKRIIVVCVWLSSSEHDFCARQRRSSRAKRRASKIVEKNVRLKFSATSSATDAKRRQHRVCTQAKDKLFIIFIVFRLFVLLVFSAHRGCFGLEFIFLPLLKMISLLEHLFAHSRKQKKKKKQTKSHTVEKCIREEIRWQFFLFSFLLCTPFLCRGVEKIDLFCRFKYKRDAIKMDCRMATNVTLRFFLHTILSSGFSDSFFPCFCFEKHQTDA